METQEESPGPRIGGRNCQLRLPFVHFLPLQANIGVGDLEVVVKGLFDISATVDSVTVPDWNSRLWAKISEGVRALHAQNLDTGYPTRLN